MKALIAYASKTGTAKKCADMLADRLDADTFNLTGGTPDLAPYDTVVIGGGIRAGSLHKYARRFIQENAGALIQKRLGLFTCNASGEDVYFTENNFGALPEYAVVKASFGGEFNLENAKGIDRLMLRAMAGVAARSGEPMRASINEETVEAFTLALK